MSRFFRSTKTLIHSGQSRILSGTLSIHSTSFQLSDSTRHSGKLVKVLVSQRKEPESVLPILQREIIETNKNNLFIWTMPTTRLNGQDEDGIYPGHNFSSATDESGLTVCTMSKRPDTKIVLGERTRIPDSRFKKQLKTIRLFSPVYTSVEEELEIWLKRALVVDEYPLFVHIIPFNEHLELNLEDYVRYVEYLKDMEEPYSLHSFKHPFSEHYVQGGNCNSATEQSIFGVGRASLADFSCQEAAINIVSRMKKQEACDYMEVAKRFGLTKGIESPTFSKEVFSPGFSC